MIAALIVIRSNRATLPGLYSKLAQRLCSDIQITKMPTLKRVWTRLEALWQGRGALKPTGHLIYSGRSKATQFQNAKQAMLLGILHDGKNSEDVRESSGLSRERPMPVVSLPEHFRRTAAYDWRCWPAGTFSTRTRGSQPSLDSNVKHQRGSID